MSNGDGSTIDILGPDGMTYPMPLNKVRDALAQGGVIKGSQTELAGRALAASGISGPQLQSAANSPSAPPTVPMQSSVPGYLPSAGQAVVDYAKGIGKGGFGTTAGMGAAAGGPQYLQGGGINQPQSNYTVPQSMQPQGTAQKAGYYTEKVGEVAAPLVLGGASVAQVLPNTERAGQAIQAVTDAAGELPVDTSGPMQIAQRIKDISGRGGTLPKVVRDFLNRMGVSVEGEVVTKAPSQMTFNEGRDFYNNSTRLSSGEYQNLTGPVKRLVGQFTGSLHNALTGTADQLGMGQAYDNAIREYANASSLQRVAQAVGKWGVQQLGRYAVPTALGYEAYRRFKNEK